MYALEQLIAELVKGIRKKMKGVPVTGYVVVITTGAFEEISRRGWAEIGCEALRDFPRVPGETPEDSLVDQLEARLIFEVEQFLLGYDPNDEEYNPHVAVYADCVTDESNPLGIPEFIEERRNTLDEEDEGPAGYTVFRLDASLAEQFAT